MRRKQRDSPSILTGWRTSFIPRKGRGGVENLNGRVRRFLPRESPPEALAQPHLRRLADRLNDTPRRCLGYRTPREVFQQHLAAPTGPP